LRIQHKIRDFCNINFLRFLLDLDRGSSLFLNRAAQHYPAFDQTVVVLSNSDLVKGGVLLALFWGLWFGRARDLTAARQHLLAGLAGSLVALGIARALSYLLPHRLRPLLEPDLHFLPPSGLPDQSNWTNWSSFPSDHAALFFAIVCGLWFVSARIGWAALVYLLLVVIWPRLYVGIHYPSDVLAGAVIAWLCVFLLDRRSLRARWTGPVLRTLEDFPALGYTIFFLLTFQIATLFWDVRIFLSYFGFST